MNDSKYLRELLVDLGDSIRAMHITGVVKDPATYPHGRDNTTDAVLDEIPTFTFPPFASPAFDAAPFSFPGSFPHFFSNVVGVVNDSYTGVAGDPATALAKSPGSKRPGKPAQSDDEPAPPLFKPPAPEPVAPPADAPSDPGAGSPEGWDPGLLAAVRMKESGNKYYFVNPPGALGAYQMHENVLHQIGWYQENGSYTQPNGWEGWFTAEAASYGVTSKQSYLDSPAAQDEAFTQLWESNWTDYLANPDPYWDLDRYVGQWMNGVEITPAGMLAGSHLMGPWGLRDYLNSGGTHIAGDYNGTTIVDYMKMFGGYYTPYD
jgi:hypothetical protein